MDTTTTAATATATQRTTTTGDDGDFIAVAVDHILFFFFFCFLYSSSSTSSFVVSLMIAAVAVFSLRCLYSILVFWPGEHRAPRRNLNSFFLTDIYIFCWKKIISMAQVNCVCVCVCHKKPLTVYFKKRRKKTQNFCA